MGLKTDKTIRLEYKRNKQAIGEKVNLRKEQHYGQ